MFSVSTPESEENNQKFGLGSSINDKGLLSVRKLPGLAGGVGSQLFHGHEHGATVSLGERRPFPKEFRKTLSLAQMDLKQKKNGTNPHVNLELLPFTYNLTPALTPTHLPELSLPQLLPEDQPLPWELGGRNVLPGQRVHGEGRHGVHVAAGDALQVHDVGLCVVRRAVVETLVRRALGDVGLGVTPSAG